jgi:hypothetical protein
MPAEGDAGSKVVPVKSIYYWAKGGICTYGAIMRSQRMRSQADLETGPTGMNMQNPMK